MAGAAEEDRGPRIAAIDVVRGVAIGAMIVYHFSFDLSAEGLIAADVVNDFGWRAFARSIAGTFLLLVGVSLVLATRRGLKWRPFLRRLALVAAGAAVVSLATWWFDPATYVFFGILHMIALASVLALPFLRLPTWLVAVSAAVAFVVPQFLASPIFNTPALWWLGLSTVPPVSVDYVPVFPWFGVVLAGMAAGRLLVAYAGDSRFARWRPSAAGRWAAVAGRWSLAIYLIHQPILVGAIYLVAPFVAPGEMAYRRELNSCITVCRVNGRDENTCTALCGCMFDSLYGTDLFDATSVELLNPKQRRRWDATVAACASEVAAPPPAE